MKKNLIIFGVLSCCITFIFGDLTCVTSLGSSTTKKCNPDDRYCAKVDLDNAFYTVNGAAPFMWPLPLMFQGCSQDMHKIYEQQCIKNGKWHFNNRTSWGAIDAEIYCCQQNLCNSAIIQTLAGAIAFTTFVNVLFVAFL